MTIKLEELTPGTYSAGYAVGSGTGPVRLTIRTELGTAARVELSPRAAVELASALMSGAAFQADVNAGTGPARASASAERVRHATGDLCRIY